MHLLFATSLVPDKAPATGYDIANAAILAALRRAGVRVTVMGFVWPGQKPADPDTIVLGELDVRTDTASMPQKLAWLGKAVAAGLTFSSIKLRAVSAQSVRAAVARAGPVDGYVLNAVQFAGAFEDVFRDRPSIFVAHNVEHQSAAENAAAARDPIQRFMFSREARLLETMERQLCDRASFVFTLAEQDREALGVRRDDRSAVLPLVTRSAPFRRRKPRELACDAAMIGTWTWQPNRIGLDWFLEAVAPHLPADFRVRIGGKTPAGVKSAHPGIEFVGRVDDATEFVQSGAVVPLTSQAGTGVQLKTLEAFELGLPCVATSRSLRGIDFLPANCTRADDPKEFARALVQTAKMGHEIDGREFYERQLAALDRRVQLGLARLGHAAPKVAA
ncbi:MAG: glycosyltransferase family 4 protein [Rhizobiaceae bacterium]